MADVNFEWATQLTAHNRGKGEIATPSPFQIHYGSVVLPETPQSSFLKKCFFKA